jgi:hypothetical protein
MDSLDFNMRLGAAMEWFQMPGTGLLTADDRSAVIAAGWFRGEQAEV